MAILISKNGKKEKIPYYEIEQKCIEIIEHLDSDMKQKFEEFKKDYHYFNPYFDFVIMILGYVIENPMGYTNSLLTFHDDKFYILKNMNYEKYCMGNVEYPKYDFFIKSDDITLNIHKISTESKMYQDDMVCLQNGIIDRQNYFLSINNLKFHQNLATLIVNQLIIKNRKIYYEFQKYDEFHLREMNFLEDKMGYIRLGISENIIFPSYRKSLISEEQKKLLSKIDEIMDIILFNCDKDKIDEITTNSFKLKK